jgi:hypothetical protein
MSSDAMKKPDNRIWGTRHIGRNSTANFVSSTDDPKTMAIAVLAIARL